ncbi:hypothetical protein [Oceaniradius stylonematis]|uniref:hypothetical protein n=1 Tax=Oceaniradius stylonematis TaxID=2184161 RepID=UPI0035D04893
MPRPACRPALRVLTRIDDLECLRVVVLAGARLRRGVEIVEQGGMRLPGFPRQFQEGRNCRRILLVRGIKRSRHIVFGLVDGSSNHGPVGPGDFKHKSTPPEIDKRSGQKNANTTRYLFADGSNLFCISCTLHLNRLYDNRILEFFNPGSGLKAGR